METRSHKQASTDMHSLSLAQNRVKTRAALLESGAENQT